ncbi:hypothetical protein Bca52824_003706 [Brassica carinata]|uniref:Uncharacterized protein n=1 Tax=Brassica carinata TaxID=52824 RepID=A0A8X7WN53_BRACI|nr:hypothetical protein Bca52824_003706 [Brassica carinata]
MTKGYLCMLHKLAEMSIATLPPESAFYLEGKGGLLEFIEKQIKLNGHMVIVFAEEAVQELMCKSMESNRRL